MASTGQHTGLLRTILFVDVCGSTKLYESLGNARAEAVIAKALDVLSQAAARHLGTLIKKIGDEIICTFIAAGDAVSAAIDMQRSLQQAVKSGEIAVKTLKIRTGFHCGPIIARHTDVFGDAVNVAARVVAHAKPGQILFTKPTLEKLTDGVAQVRYVGNTPLKGKKQPLELFEVIWERDGLTQAQIPTQTRRGDMRLTARLKATTLELGPDRASLRMGRGAENEFVVADPLVSRTHARIEYRHDRFVLIDQSLNGTYLRRQGMAEVALRREEIALEGSGLIGLGKTPADAPQLCVRFTVHRRGANATSRRRVAPEP
jgi:adenylate cyclase